MMRVTEGGQAIAVEIWAVPLAGIGIVLISVIITMQNLHLELFFSKLYYEVTNIVSLFFRESNERKFILGNNRLNYLIETQNYNILTYSSKFVTHVYPSRSLSLSL